MVLAGIVLDVHVSAESTTPVAAPKDHVLFVGTDLSVKQNGEFCHVVGATKNTLKIEKDRRLLDVRLGEGTSIRINKGVKLSNLSATISNLHTECEDREAARTQLAAMHSSMLISAEAADQEDRMHGALTLSTGTAVIRQEDVIHGTDSADALKAIQEEHRNNYVGALPALDLARDTAQTFLTDTVARTGSINDELTLDASDLPGLRLLGASSNESLGGRVVLNSSVQVDLGFAVSSPQPLDHAYLIVVANYSSPTKPDQTARQISAREFSRIDSKPQQVKLTHAASLNGLPFRKFDIALFANGQEVATNLSEKRLALTSDQAFQFFLIDHLSAHKGATLPPTPMLMTPRMEFRRQVEKTELNQTIYANVDKMGNVLGMSTDVAGKQRLPSLVESALQNVRFLPALNNGAPVEGRVMVTLAQLAN